MATPDEAAQRWRWVLGGAAQGVGLRPFVARLACELALGGFVRNAGAGVEIEAEGPDTALARLRECLLRDAPGPGLAEVGAPSRLAPRGDRQFVIAPSAMGPVSLDVPLDVAVCAACVAEIRDPRNRRYRHAFNHCAACGPRWTVLVAPPFDRERTTLRDFPLCAACRGEYADADDRRHHAQGISCHDCGPRLTFLHADGTPRATGEDALGAALALLRAGGILALKGMGGFQLWTLAADAASVALLRARKRRPDKPLAVMVRDLAMARELCTVDAAEEAHLAGPAAPILLLARRDAAPGSPVAPGMPELGVMLPATPLQQLLLDDLGAAVVATSGNRGGEPLCYLDSEACARLAGIADGFLVHDRRILRALDDSVARVVRGELQILRLARGYAPLVLPRPTAGPARLARGGDVKNAVAVAQGTRMLLGPHVGDLALRASAEAHAARVADLVALCGRPAPREVCDAHPDYLSSAGAAPDAIAVQHHYAHALAALAEHAPRLRPPFLALTWDGSGLGADGNLWGGEWLLVEPRGWRRLASLWPFRLPGGEAAVRDPRRIAHALRHVAQLDVHDDVEHATWTRQIVTGVNAPWSSSVGRLFDGVAALIATARGDYRAPSFEGQLALELEAAARGATSGWDLPALLPARGDDGVWRFDWRPLLRALHAALRGGAARDALAAGFHRALTETADHAKDLAPGQRQVVLCGGVFQNRLLLEGLHARLAARGWEVFWPARVPINDGGLAVGQLLAAGRVTEASACA